MSDGQDFATFEAGQNGATEATPPVAAPPPADPPEVDTTPDAPEVPEAELVEGEQPQPKPKKTAQERIDEVTRARREAERERDYFRNLYEGKVKPQPEQRQVDEPKAPDPNAYDLGDLDPQYVKDTIAFEVKRGLDSVRTTVAQDLHIQAGERVWEARQDEARSKFADYDDKVISGAHNWPCTPEMAEAIKTSDAGGEVAYHLASNPEEARRIASLSPIAQVRELGRIEARLETGAAAPVKTTNAPKPPQAQARGAGGHFTSNGATQNFAEFEAMANRKT